MSELNSFIKVLEKGTPDQILDWVNANTIQSIRGHLVPNRFSDKEIVDILRGITDEEKRIIFARCCTANGIFKLKG